MQYNRSITATVYVIRDGRVLLHEHKKYSTWFPLGGHIEADEFPHEAALREVKEESGLDVTLIKTENAPAIDLGRVDRIPAPFCLCHEGIGHEEEFFDFIFIAKTDEAEPHPSDGESRRFKWFTREELLSYDLKPHIKNTALAALEYYMEQNKNTQNNYEIKVYHTLPECAKEIRVTVFVEEQGFVEEFDTTDHASMHFVLFDGATAAATCRVFRTEHENTYTLGRLAVRKEYRGKRLGTRLVRAAEEYAREQNAEAVILHAQCSATRFYESCGFSAYGGIEYEQDCPHIRMRKDLRG